MFTQQNEVALFIDFENIHTSVRNSALNAYYVDYRVMLNACEQYGRIAMRRAYSDWAENAKYQDALARFGIESRNAFGRGKNVSDIFLAVEAMETLHTHPEIQTYILVSGDGDFSVLVHRLRNHHKRVVGMGVKGATSQGLVEACDEFIFYDDLLQEAKPKEQLTPVKIKEPPPLPPVKETIVKEVVHKEAAHKEPPPPKELPAKEPAAKPGKAVAAAAPEDRLQRLQHFLERALPPDGSWINGATLVYRLRGLHRGFDREMQQLGFERFRDFLEAMEAAAEIRSAPGKGHMEVRKRGATTPTEVEEEVAPPEPTQAQQLTETDYLNILEQQRPRVTPNRYRPTIILKIYDLMMAHQPPTLNKLKGLATQDLKAFGEALVEEIIHQLYHTYSFELERLSDVPQWDRPCRFQEYIKSGFDLLDNCDLRLLQRLQNGLPDHVALDPAVVAHILYGDSGNAHILKRTHEILARLEPPQ